MCTECRMRIESIESSTSLTLETLQMRIRELEAQIDEQEHAMIGHRNNHQITQRLENEVAALTQGNEGLRVRLVDETKRYERMLRDRNASMKNLAEAEMGAKRQVEDLAARDATITQLRDQVTKITADTIKKSGTDWTNRQHSTRRQWMRRTPRSPV